MSIFRNDGWLRGVQLCSAGESITVDGQTFVADAATAYVEFFLSHAFPVYLDQCAQGDTPDRTTIHPQTVANSFRSLVGKVVNLAHLMRSYDPSRNPRDRIMGTVMAVEFPPSPEGGWKVQGDPAMAPGIRGVAALHKAAEGVEDVIATWSAGRTPYGPTEWTVSMENESFIDEGGFLVRCGAQTADLAGAWESTPDDFKSLGWTYVPYASAPDDLRACLKPAPYLGIERDYRGQETLFLNGGLGGRIFYYGVALTPAGKEGAARVARINASKMDLVDLGPAIEAIEGFCEEFSGG